MKSSTARNGFAPIWIFLVLIAGGVTAYAGKTVVDKVYTQAHRDTIATEELLRQSPNYLDKDKLRNAVVDGPVIGIVSLPDGSYSAYKINRGSVGISPTGKISYTTNIEIEFMTGDVGTGTFQANRIME